MLSIRTIVLRPVWCIVALSLVAGFEASAQALPPTLIYSTGFEPEEGFDREFTLIGQQGWVGEGTGGNGLLVDFFPGYGQQAFIGFTPPEQGDQVLNVWRPVNLAPIPAGQTLVKFSVIMQIVDSTNRLYDDFRWSVYNAQSDRLFTLDFDNTAHHVNYALDDNVFRDTGVEFDNDGTYDLTIWMNFARNHWTATLNGYVVVNSQPITTKGSALNLGDIDAVWAVRTPGFPGNNFMLFDEYTITAEGTPSIPATLEPAGFNDEGEFVVRVLGEEGVFYSIDATTDFVDWVELYTRVQAPAGGIFEKPDFEAPLFPLSFYRVRAVQ